MEKKDIQTIDEKAIKKALDQLEKDYRREYPGIQHIDEKNRQYRFLAFYNYSRCSVSKSCKMARTSPYTYYKWLEDPAFKKIMEFEERLILDDVESDMYNLCRKNVIAGIFTLKSRRPEKWSDRRDINISGSVTHLTYEEALKLLEKKKPKQIEEGEIVENKKLPKGKSESNTAQEATKGKK